MTGPLRRFLEDTRDLVLDGLARLGLLPGGAAWWKARRARRRAERAAERENLRRAIRARHRMCRQCGTLVPAELDTCPACGASMRGIPRGGLGRAAGLLLPSFGSASTTLLAAIVVVYLATAIGPPGGSLWQPPTDVLFALGMKWTPAILAGQWWRLVTAIFLHGSLLHIAFNGYALANLGPAIEGVIGSRRFLVVFVGTGVASFATSALVMPAVPSLGASGALFGLIGFGIAYGWRRGGSLGALKDDLVRWAIFGLILLLAPGIDHAAHAGGFVAGLVLGAAMAGEQGSSPARDHAWTIAATIAGLLPVIAFALALFSMASSAS